MYEICFQLCLLDLGMTYSVDLTTEPLWNFHGLSTADPKSDTRDNSGVLTAPLWDPGVRL